MARTTPDARPSRYGELLGALSTVLIDHSTLEGTLEQLLHVATAAAPAVDAMTVTTMADDDGYTSAATTDAAARSVDEHEYLIEEGPCIDALHSGSEQFVTDAHTDERWPRFASFAAAAGFRTVLGLPLAAPDGQVLGALNVFARSPDALAEEDLALLRQVAVPAGAILANARAYHRTAAISDQLTASLEQRATWHRAIGIVLGRHGGDEAGAAEVLARTAEAEGVPVERIAEQLARGAPVSLRGV
ncbi:MAG: GAF and ANTAR domain-containing protein [Nitriliruptor sp.]|uniref:GAF and ANTAR domain-containing protein n=1 Tax=Nitriliruptor sp. TaxID=2448056 RepID=UPI0034A0A173